MPFCFECGAIAEHQHHVIPRSLGGTRTVPLCATCHGKVHDAAFVRHAALSRRALACKKSLGQKTGGDVPYGFTLATDGKTLEAHADEQAMIAAIREARERGLSQRAIVAELASKGFTTRKGTALGLKQVQRIMHQAAIA